MKRTADGLKVAGVTCYTPERCVAPPSEDGSDCVNGELRLSGDNAVNGAGTLEYCYNGRWSGFCSLGEKEAVVACRQLGYVDYNSEQHLLLNYSNYCSIITCSCVHIF